MKPPERAPPSKAAKQGSVLPVSMRGTRLPSNSCTCRLSAAVATKPQLGITVHAASTGLLSQGLRLPGMCSLRAEWFAGSTGLGLHV